MEAHAQQHHWNYINDPKLYTQQRMHTPSEQEKYFNQPQRELAQFEHDLRN